MQNKNYDLTIIGGGPGGYVAAIRGAQLGLQVAVIEKDKLGGVCLNWGCIPTKALLKNAEIYNLLKNSEEYGLNVDQIKIDFKKIIKRSRDVALRNSKGVEYLFKKNYITHISGFGRLISNDKVEILRDGKVSETITSKHIIIATGARPRTIPGIEIDRKKIITSKEAMLLDEPPEKLVIIGAGAIGVEFAYFYNTFGTKVTLIEMLPNILPQEDKEISKLLESIFKKSGIEIITNSKVEKATIEDKVKISLSTGGNVSEIEGDIALIAIGVQGNIENIGLDVVGIKHEKSFINVDNYYRTNVNGVYAIGDVIGPPLLAHVASAEGIICVEAIAGKNPAVLDYNNVPGCTYCQPQVASIGLTEEEAIRQGYKIKVGRFPFSASGKARAIGETDGLVKLIFDEKYGELLGAHILGSDATEMIAEIGIARTLGTTAYEIIKTVHAHPTLSEAIMEAAANAYGESIHI